MSFEPQGLQGEGCFYDNIQLKGNKPISKKIDLYHLARDFEKYYQWDKTAKKWEDYFDSVELKPSEETWLSAPRIHHPRNGNTENMSNSEYARWLIVNVLGEPERLNTYFESRLIRDLNYAMFINGMGDAYLNEDSFKFLKPLYEPFDRQKAYDMMADICELKNFWENKRKEVIQ